MLLKPAVFAGGTLHIMCLVQFLLNCSFHFLNHSRTFTQFAVDPCRWKTVSAKCHTSSTLKVQWVCQLHTAPTAHLLLLNCIVSHRKYQSGRVRWRKILPHFTEFAGWLLQVIVNCTINSTVFICLDGRYSSCKLYSLKDWFVIVIHPKDFHKVYFGPDDSMKLQLAPYSPVQDGKSGLETAETILSAGRFTLYMLLKSRSDTEGARNPCQIARHQASKGPTQPFNGCAFQALLPMLMHWGHKQKRTLIDHLDKARMP